MHTEGRVIYTSSVHAFTVGGDELSSPEMQDAPLQRTLGTSPPGTPTTPAVSSMTPAGCTMDTLVHQSKLPSLPPSSR